MQVDRRHQCTPQQPTYILPTRTLCDAPFPIISSHSLPTLRLDLTDLLLPDIFLNSLEGRFYRQLYTDEVHDSISPHPDCIQVLKKFFELSVVSYMQRISLTGTLPPFIMNVFMVKMVSSKLTKTIRATTNHPEVGLIVVEVNQWTSMLRNVCAIVMALEEELADRDRILVFFQSWAECKRFSRDSGLVQYHSKLPSGGTRKKLASAASKFFGAE